jgi:hypothetical protein
MAIYFSESKGRIVFTASAVTTLNYFTVKSLFECSTYFVSTAPTERWTAGRTKGNFTLASPQHVCLLHVSDNVMEVAGVFDTEPESGNLYYEYSGSTSTTDHYTGSGTFSESSIYVTVFAWGSAEGATSTAFSVHLSSPGSSLPDKRCRGTGKSQAPLLLDAEGPLPARTPSRAPARTSRSPRTRQRAAAGVDNDDISAAERPAAVSGTEAGLIAGFAMVWVVSGLLLRVARPTSEDPGDRIVR